MRNRLLMQSIFCTWLFFIGAEAAAQSDVIVEAASAVISGGSLPAVGSFVEAAFAPSAKVKSVMDGQIPALQNYMGAAGMATVSLLNEIQLASNNYFISKDSCASAADNAEMFCIESKSMQAIKAKDIIDAAGLALAATSSAQKTCSDTASATGLAQQAMTLAKGACVGSKLICDTSCSKAATELKTISAKTASFITAAATEIDVGLSRCSVKCAELLVVKTALLSFQSTVPQAVAAESSPAPIGTTGSLVLRCQGYSKDVLLFGMNILSLFTASKSATECANKLASGPTSPTKVEYCNLPANTATSFCKCQKDNAAEGCPGHLAAVSTASKSPDGKANDIKSSGNGNQFAGGFDKIKVSPIDLGGLKADPTGASPDAKKEKDAPGTTDQGGLAAGSPGGGSNGSGAGKTSDSKEAVAGDDKKKLGLGSFFGMGGGSSAGSGSGKSGNGALGQKNMDAIQRQIASEKLRAEVSGASGKSNWEKVSERYLRNKATLLVGQ